MANNAGAPALTGKRDFDEAKQLIAGAGYKGERIVVLDAVDTPNPHAHALVAADLLKKLGLNVEIAVSDWGNLVIRRASKKPAADGGGNIFVTGWVGADMLEPALNRALRANGDGAWFGWPKDDTLEALRTQRLKPTDNEARQEIAAAIQLRAFETDRGVEDQDGLSEKPQGSSSRSGNLPVECRKHLSVVTLIASGCAGFAMLRLVNSQ